MKQARLQRKCSCEAGGGTCPECEQKKRQLQRSASGPAPDMAPPIVDEVLRTPGQPLDAGSRSWFEKRFACDFSSVRVHADSQAAASARSVGAHAYAVGNHIAFATGEYAPQTPGGRRLLAHELAHVVQQQDAPLPASGQIRIENSAALESEADSAARANGASGAAVPIASAGGEISLQRSTGRGICGGGESCSPAERCGQADPGHDAVGPSNSFSMTVFVDIDRPDWESAVRNQEFGHTHVRLEESVGRRYSYGFYPAGALPNENRRMVPGCVRHPDTAHERCAEEQLNFTLTGQQYTAALAEAQRVCRSPGQYGQTYTCTTFAAQVAAAAGQSIPSSRSAPTTIFYQRVPAIDNPNTLYDNIQIERARDPNRRSPYWNNRCINDCEGAFRACTATSRTGGMECIARRGVCYRLCEHQNAAGGSR